MEENTEPHARFFGRLTVVLGAPGLAALLTTYVEFAQMSGVGSAEGYTFNYTVEPFIAVRMVFDVLIISLGLTLIYGPMKGVERIT